MLTLTDQLKNRLHLPGRPRRIVSLVPSQSELLWDLGLREELVGITKFCIHPKELFQTVTRVGGTKNLNLEKIRSLKPDLIIGNKEENERSQIEQLQKEFPVWMSDIYTLDDAMAMIHSLGELFDKSRLAQEISVSVERSLATVKGIFKGQRVAYFIWNNPYILAANSTFIDHVLTYLGLINAASGLERYPAVDEQALKNLDPELCFLSSEPFPFKDKHVKEVQALLPNAKIRIVDGEVFSWYGSRLLHLARYAEELSEVLRNV